MLYFTGRAAGVWLWDRAALWSHLVEQFFCQVQWSYSEYTWDLANKLIYQLELWHGYLIITLCVVGSEVYLNLFLMQLL